MPRRHLRLAAAATLPLLLLLSITAAGCRHDLGEAPDAASDAASDAALDVVSGRDASPDGTADTAAQDDAADDAPTGDAAGDDAGVDVAPSQDARCGASVNRGVSPLNCKGRVVGGAATCSSGSTFSAVRPRNSSSWQAACRQGTVTALTTICLQGHTASVQEWRQVQFKAANGHCAPNHTLVGGGCQCSGTALLRESRPITSNGVPRGWRCACSDVDLIYSLVCLPDAEVACYGVHAVTGTTSAACGAGSVLLGGGCEAQAFDKTTISGKSFACSGVSVTKTWAICARAY